MSSRSLMHRVFPPSEPPDGGCPQSFRLVIGGTQLRGSWYLSAIVRLQGFSSCSPAAPLRRWSPKTVTTSPWMGRGKPCCDLGPALSFKDVHHPCWGGERGEPGLYLPRGPAGHLLFQLLARQLSALRPSLLQFGHPERGPLSLLPERATASRPSVFCCSAGPPMSGAPTSAWRRRTGAKAGPPQNTNAALAARDILGGPPERTARQPPSRQEGAPGAKHSGVLHFLPYKASNGDIFKLA
jgi:hypothetical protein